MKNFRNISVVLPIAGRERRFWPLRNKHFLPFLGKPIICYHLSALERYGFNNIVLVVNEGNKILAQNLIASYSKLSFEVVKQETGKGLGAAILATKNVIKDQIIVLSPHDVFPEVLFQKIAKKIKAGVEALLVAKKINRYFPGGYVMSEKGMVKKIIEKPAAGEQPSNTVALVFYYFKESRSLIEAIEKEREGQDDQFERAVTDLLRSGLRMETVPLTGFWGYLKYPWDTLTLMGHYLRQLDRKEVKEAKIHPSAIIEGPVLLEKNVIVNPHASIVGPCYIGEGTIIGNNALVRSSHIGKDNVIGYATEVARSYIGDNCWFHTNYVGDSVLGKNIAMGAGTILANFRLDEEEIFSTVSGHEIHQREEKIVTGKRKLGAVIGNHVRIGVNASIMPGIKIGSNVAIGAGVILDRDIKEDKACFLEKECYNLSDNRINIEQLKRRRS